jgi:hypothetical protein
MFNPVQLGSNFARNVIIRYAPLAVGLMTIEHLFRSTAPAVGLKPSAMECKARLRGLWRIMYSKTIRPRPGKAKPARAPRHTGATPAHPGGASCRRDARTPMPAGATPAHPGGASCRRDAHTPMPAGATPAHPGMRAGRPRGHTGATPAPPGMRVRRPRGMRARRPRPQACGCDARAPRPAQAGIMPERSSVALAGRRPTESRFGIRSGRHAPGSARTSETGWHLQASSRSFR